MKIDFHAHILPPAFLRKSMGEEAARAREERTPELVYLDRRIADLDMLGVDLQVVSLGPPGCPAGSPDERTAMARLFNDDLAEALRSNPERYRGLATVPLWDVDAALAEVRRSVEELGLSGISLFTTYDDRPLDDPEFRPVFELAVELDIPVLLHPSSSTCAETLDDLGLTVTIGYVHETAMCASRLAVSGLLRELPSLKLVLCHMGGYLPFVIERFDAISSARQRTRGAADWNGVEVQEALRLFYIDTVSHHEAAYRCAMETWDNTRILLGSDYPYSKWSECVREIEALDLEPSVEAAIFEDNARELLKL